MKTQLKIHINSWRKKGEGEEEREGKPIISLPLQENKLQP